MEDSGEFDARKVRNSQLRIPIGWAALISIVGGLITYGAVSGQNSQRMAELERRSQEQTNDARLLATQVASHDVKIAVIDQKLDTIISEVGRANEQLARAQAERK